MFHSDFFQEFNSLEKEIIESPVSHYYECIREIGLSRSGLAIYGEIIGSGKKVISLIGGSHAEEPIGPLFLRKLTVFLRSSHPLAENLKKNFTFYLAPHVNPDAEVACKKWWDEETYEYDFASYLKYRIRELPGDDVEFSYPGLSNSKNHGRVENLTMINWWEKEKSFTLHGSFHGLSFAPAAWFLLDERNKELIPIIKEYLQQLPYPLLDINRKGEKGFHYLAPGFSTYPNGAEMALFFRKKNDHLTASKFGYSSMDWIKQHSPKCRCFVTENPLFLTPEFERQKISICYQFQRHQKMIQKTQQLPFEKINEEFKDLGFQKNPIELQLKLLCFTLYCHLSQLN